METRNEEKSAISKDDERFMSMALDEARLAMSEGEIPVGAVMVCRSRVVARAHNQTEALNDVTAHAEMIAITSAANLIGGKYLTDCTLYVTVEPCSMCASALGWAHVSRVVYGASDEKRGYRRLAPGVLHPKTIVSAGVLSDDCAALMKEFFRERR
ncbi:MAG: nucleoside deaminase [Prevotella sp.]|nr:nucleoside deaminase [Prevotella sp.]